MINKIFILFIVVIYFLNSDLNYVYSNNISKNKIYIVSSKDNILVNKISKKVVKFGEDRNINLEVLVNKIEKNIKNRILSERLSFIINEIILNLRGKICNNYYKVHKNTIASVFWVGENSDSSNAYISNISSAWDEEWLEHSNNENKYYFALPYNDLDENGDRKENIKNIPWYNLKKWGENESIVKNRWIKIKANNKIAYAQWEDVGPLKENDFGYVFGNANSKNTFGLKAGIDLSPDLADYLNINGEGKVNWQFVPEYCVDNSIFKEKITKSNLNWK